MQWGGYSNADNETKYQGRKCKEIAAVLLLIGTFGLIQSLSKNEQLLSNKAFAQFPLNLAEEWKGRELGLDEKVLDVLNLPKTMSVGFVTGCQMANFTGLLAGRNTVLKRAGCDVSDTSSDAATSRSGTQRHRYRIGG